MLGLKRAQWHNGCALDSLIGHSAAELLLWKYVPRYHEDEPIVQYSGSLVKHKRYGCSSLVPNQPVFAGVVRNTHFCQRSAGLVGILDT